MKRLAEKFEALIERFLRTNLERHTRVLSWTVLLLLAVCVTATYFAARKTLPIRDPSTNLTREVPVIDLLLDRGL